MCCETLIYGTEYFSGSLHLQSANYSTYTERRSASETAIEFGLYHFNRSEPTYKSQCIKLLDVTAACNQLNVNALIR